MFEEIYKTIEEFPNYEVSNLGNVRNKKTKRVLKSTKTTWGYYTVHIKNKEGKYKCPKIHRLVAITFIPNPDNKPEVNHKSGDKDDNSVFNLEWCTRAENEKHKYNTLQKNALIEINNEHKRACRCIETGEIFESVSKAAKEKGINQGNLWATLDGRHKTCGGYHWEYI